MNEPQRDRVQDLFDRAVALPQEERTAFLDAACADDHRLRTEVQSLLVYDALFPESGGDVGILKSPIVPVPAPATSRTESALAHHFPVSIERYRVLRRIAEGGMGTVYEAEQDSPRRAVALKVVRRGLASDAFVRRFRHEAQILARLHHPGIAQVYAAGLDDDGQPFFAMELIRGLPLDEYVCRHSLDLRARAVLLAQVCDAVQHAHEQGVIHRDLKPANILVEESGRPKVVDFGVARATGADLLTAAGLTRTGQLLGTPNYMSPEQVTAEPESIDRRADVYALGVILFELAADRPPLELEDRPVAEAARLILERDPPALGSIRPELRGDVETIAAKALEKNPARRYASAAELAADLRRWLDHEPIQARPPSALYHFRKFARRHKALVGGTAATVAALVLGMVTSTLFAIGEAQQRGAAERNALQATAERRETQFQAYRARVAAAAATLSTHDVAAAARQLDAVPEALRRWEWRHLRSRLDDSSAVIPVPETEFPFLIGAPDRLRLGAFTAQGLRLIDLESGKEEALPIGPGPHREFSALPTSRGLRVAAWVSNTAFNLLDERGKVVCRMELPNADEPSPVVASPDGTRLATLRASVGQKWLAVFDATSGKHTASLDVLGSGTVMINFNRDGSRLASAGEDRKARVWDPSTGALLATCRGHISKVLDVTFSPDGARLATASADGTVRQWDAATGQEVEPPYDRHSGEVLAAVYSPDGQRVASVATDRTIRVWRATGREDLEVLHGHTGHVTRLAFGPDGRRLASLVIERRFGFASDDTVRLWDVDPAATLPVLRGHTSYVYPVAYSPDGRWIASGGWDGTVRLWDAATGEPCATLPHPGVVHDLAYGPDGTWLVSACLGDRRLRVWDVATGRLRKEIQVPVGEPRHVLVRPDGRRLAVSTEGSLEHGVFDFESGDFVFSAEGLALTYSPDGRWLAVLAAGLKTLLLLNAQTHEVAAKLPGHEESVWSATFSRDSRWLASCGSDRTVRLWDIDTGLCRVLHGHTDDVYAAAFHPDGKRLATAGRDRAIWLWDLERGEDVARLPGHADYVWSLAFSPDGESLVSGSGDFTVRFWDTQPLKRRYEARRKAEALRPEAALRVESLWRNKPDPAEVVAALRADEALSETQRHASLRAVLRRAQPPEASAGNSPDPL
jgi:WD40 repeat protein/predicted Ser/Thr protein kinase